MTKNPRLITSIEEDLKNQFEKNAAQQGISTSELLRKLIIQSIVKEKKKN